MAASPGGHASWHRAEPTSRLTAYGGDYGDLPWQLLQSVLDDLAAGTLALPIDRVYRLDEIAEAHQALEDGTTLGKQVVLT
jgi:NADPH:quinone reductase